MINEFYSGSHTETQLTAAAYRAADSILRSTKYLLPSIGQELLALLTLDTLWGLCLLAAGWFLVSVISGPLGLAVNVVLLGYGVYSAWGTIEETYEQFKDWFWGFYSARNEAELDKAGEHFARGVVQGGMFALQLLLTHRAVRFASKRLVKRYPPPDKLRQRFVEEQKRATEQKQAAIEKRPKVGKQNPEAERTRTSPPSEEPSGQDPRLLRTLRELNTTLQAQGSQELGLDLPNASKLSSAVFFGLTTLLTTGVVALALAAASSQSRRRRGQ